MEIMVFPNQVSRKRQQGDTKQKQQVQPQLSFNNPADRVKVGVMPHPEDADDDEGNRKADEFRPELQEGGMKFGSRRSLRDSRIDQRKYEQRHHDGE